MQKFGSYQRIVTGALLLLFTAFWSLKTMHGFLFHHHDHSGHPVCEAAYDHHGTHLHDERWAKADCSLCAFVVSVAEPFSLPSLPDLFAKHPDATLLIFYSGPGFIPKTRDAVLLRGPPSFCATQC